MLDLTATKQRTVVYNGTTYYLFNGDWNGHNTILPLGAKIEVFGQIFTLPSMSILGRETINGQVQGFKKSTNQLHGLIRSATEKGEKTEHFFNDLSRLLIIANCMMANSTVYGDDEKQFFYEEAKLICDDTDEYSCKLNIVRQITWVDGTKGSNFSLSIRENTPFAKQEPVRQLTAAELDLLNESMNGYMKR